MYIIREYCLRDFEPWAGAKAVYNRFTADELERLEEFFTEIKESWTETEINDEFWFNDETLLEILGISEDEFWKREGE